MRFQVPQFIEVEDKIFGPLTFKQFVYVAGGAGICVVLFTLLPKFFAFIISVPIALFALALAFYKINDKPFIGVAEAYFKYTFGSKLYIWKKQEKTAVGKTDAERQRPVEQMYVPKLSDSKLKDLTWELDIKEQNNPVTRDEKGI
ncbi:MAG: seg [Parcubacteria group bacterium]|nr:seg [Parcubacteria group bacterium]